MKKNFIIIILLAIIVLLFYLLASQKQLNNFQSNNTNQAESKTTLTEAEARTIAEQTCIKGGESLALGTYNAGTKTWWFDANLNATKEGCNPACVVSESTKSAEINWRCTGLLQP